MDAGGRRLCYFKTSAHHLIGAVPESGRVIAVAKRESGRADLSVIDLFDRKAYPWCSAKLSCFALRFDGQLWAVAHENAMMLIEVPNVAYAKAGTAKHGIHAVWHVADLPAPVRSIEWDAAALKLMLRDGEIAHAFEYRWPALTLARRELVQNCTGHPFFDVNGPAVLWAYLAEPETHARERKILSIAGFRGERKWHLQAPNNAPLVGCKSNVAWIALNFSEDLSNVDLQFNSWSRV